MPTMTVHVPAVFQPTVGGRDSIELTGDTLGEALRSAQAEYPQFVEAVLAADGSIQPYVHLFVAGMPANDPHAPIVDGSELTVVSAVAGG